VLLPIHKPFPLLLILALSRTINWTLSFPD
jgi:hypothetical protein